VTLIAAALLIAVFASGHHQRAPGRRAVPRENLDRLLNEIGSAIFSFAAVAVSTDAIGYIYRTPTDEAELRVYEITTGTVQSYVLAGCAPLQAFFWSPGGRYLPVQTEDKAYWHFANARDARPQRLFVFDRELGRLVPVAAPPRLMANYGVWLDSTSLLYTATAITGDVLEPAAARLLALDNGAPQEREIHLPRSALDALSGKGRMVTACAPHSIAFCEADTVQTLDLATGSIVPLPTLSKPNFTGFNWLNWSADNNCLLFCATRSGEDYRNLFACDPAQQSLARLTSAHSYSGQWLRGGQAYAAVLNRAGDFSLLVHTREIETNLFTSGFVERYSAAAKGDLLAAIAATNAEPRGLWLYDLATKVLTCVQPGSRTVLRHAKVRAAASLRVPAAGGLEIPIYLFTPADDRPGKRYPLVVYVPPRTGPAHRGYEIRPQLLANLGFFYAGVNYRGCDGYGSGYAEKWDPQKAAEDVFQAIQKLKTELPVDPKAIFAVSASAGSTVLERFLDQFPGSLRAAAFLEPVPWELCEAVTPHPLPPLFVAIGENDPSVRFVRDLQRWSQRHAVSATCLFMANYAHVTQDVSKRLIEERGLAEFLMVNL
jgi:hypothetical protein